MSAISYHDYRESVIKAGVDQGYPVSTMKLSLDLEAKLSKIQTHHDLADDYRQMGNAHEYARHKSERALLLSEVLHTISSVPGAREAHRMAQERAAR